jgi:hypothetical protein
MKWYKVFLSNDQILQGLNKELQDQFFLKWMKTASNNDAAMFGELNSQTNGANFYFSPGAAAIFIETISLYQGVETDPPEIINVTLLVGHNAAWDLLKKG